MTGSATALYAPALRMKAGELQGIRDLASDIAECVLPRIIVPPPSERDQSFQPRLLESAAFPDVSEALSTHWPNRDVLVEATHLIDEFGRDQTGLWFPKMFERARASRVRATPIVQLRDLLSAQAGAFQFALDRSAELQFGLVISSGDLDDRESLARAMDELDHIGLSPGQCLVVADFHDANLSAPEVVAPIIGAALETLQILAPWQQVVFQGTNFPEKNPAQPGCYCLVPRNEWIAWRKAVTFDPETKDYLLFGDYAADCAKLEFGASAGTAIRHYRYTTQDAWLVQRGSNQGKVADAMRNVCEEILASGHFAGRAFSSADDYIFKTANGHTGPGNAKDWRAVNTTHHITRVVADIGAVRGRHFDQKTVEPLPVQSVLFS